MRMRTKSWSVPGDEHAAQILGDHAHGDVLRRQQELYKQASHLLTLEGLPAPVITHMVAAEIAVPLPLRIPVIVVVNVIAGVVVLVATVPAKPLADTTDTLVTVPVFVALIVMLPAPLLMVIPVPGVKVALVRVFPVVLPINN